MALTLPKATSSSVDLQDPSTRQYILDQLGAEQPKPKASFLERVGSLLSFTETGNAAYTLVKTGNPLEAFKTYGSDIFKGVTGAFTGNIDKDKKTYSDVLKFTGIEDNLVTGLGGLALDIATDPFTYLSAGTKAGVEVGGKTLTSKGAKVFNNAKLRSAMDIASEMGIKVGKSDDVVDLLRKAPTEDFLKATNKLAKKAGIPLVSPVTDIKLVPQVLETFGKQRLNKVFKLTGADLVKEVGAEGAKAVQEAGELFAKPSLRFAGKELFTLSDQGSTLAKAVVDPVSLGMETVSKSKHVQPLLAKAKGLINTFKSSGRSLFDTTYDASLVGLKNYNADMKQLHNFVDNIVGKTGENADEVMKVMSTITESPHLLPELVERTSWLDGEALSDLKKFYTKVDNISENSFLRFFNTKSALNNASLKAKGDAFIKAWDARDIDTLKQIINTVPSDHKLHKVMKNKLEKAAANNFKWMEIAGHYELNDDYGIAKLAKEIQGEKLTKGSLPFITSAKDRQKVFQELGIKNVNDHLTRHAIGKGDELYDAKGYIIQSKLKDTYDTDKILGSRVYDMMAQGRSEGEVLYAIDDVMKGRAWDTLSKAEQKKARAEITSVIVETEAKFQAAKAYHHFLTYTKDAVNDAGEKLLTKVDELDDVAVDALRKQGYREIKRTGELLKGYIAPPEVANMLENTYKTLFDPDQANGFLKAFDKVTGMWKQSVTSWFPAFHIRNGMSNIFANAMAGVTNPKRYIEAKEVQKYMNLSAKHGVSEKVLREAGEKKIGQYTIAEIVDFADQHSIIGAGTYFDEISEGLAKTRPGQVKKLIPTSKDFILTEIGSTVGNYVEGNAKLALFIDQLQKGNAIEDSANMVKKVLFDYGDLTDFEKNVMRRVVPFYTWTRKNAEFMTRYAVANPGKFGAILKTFRDVQTSLSDIPDEDIEKLPAWARAGFSVISGSGKDASAITGFGTPIEAFGEFMDSFTNSRSRTFLNFVGPIPRGVIEKATGVSLFTGKPIKNDTDGQKFRQLPGFIKDAIGYKEIQRTSKDGSNYIEYIINPNTKWILNMFVGRGLNETSKLLETIDDPSAVQVLNLLTGIKRYEFNIDEEQVKREREAAQLLLDMLIAEGLGKEYTIGGLTKEAKLELGLTDSI